jgi:CubicO group peptidase (beta-lactamase class C family)
MGQGYGLGVAVRTEAGQNPLPGSVGSFYWIGSYGTTFYVDPKEKLIMITMVQLAGGETEAGRLRHAIRFLSYRALTPND